MNEVVHHASQSKLRCAGSISQELEPKDNVYLAGEEWSNMSTGAGRLKEWLDSKKLLKTLIYTT